MSILKHERYRLLKFIVLNMRMAFYDKTEGVRLNVSKVERKNASLWFVLHQCCFAENLELQGEDSMNWNQIVLRSTIHSSITTHG